MDQSFCHLQSCDPKGAGPGLHDTMQPPQNPLSFGLQPPMPFSVQGLSQAALVQDFLSGTGFPSPLDHQTTPASSCVGPQLPVSSPKGQPMLTQEAQLLSSAGHPVMQPSSGQSTSLQASLPPFPGVHIPQAPPKEIQLLPMPHSEPCAQERADNHKEQKPVRKQQQQPPAKNISAVNGDGGATVAAAKLRFLEMTLSDVPQDALELKSRIPAHIEKGKEGRRIALRTTHFPIKLDHGLKVIYHYDVDIRPDVSIDSKREAIVNLSHSGMTPTKIAKALNIHGVTVYKVLNKFKAMGSVKRKPGSGRPCSARTPAMIRAIKGKIQHNPIHSMRRMAKEMNVRERTVRRIVKEDLGAKSRACTKEFVALPRDVMRQVFETRPEFQGHYPAYDGNKNFFIKKRIQVPSDVLLINIMDPEEERMREFNVRMQYAADVDMEALFTYLNEGTSLDRPQTALQALDIIFRQAPEYVPAARSYFSSTERTVHLGSGVECWQGFYTSVRPGWTCYFLNMDGVKIWYTQGPKGAKRRYSINEVRRARADKEVFNCDGKPMTVAEFWRSTYGQGLKYPNLPCVWVGSKKKTIYIPVEVCNVVRGQQARKLDEEQAAAMIKHTAKPPAERRMIVERSMRQSGIQGNEHLEYFGISVADQLQKVSGRLLDPPELKYKDSKLVKPKEGKWDMRNCKFVDGKSLSKWILVSFCPYFDQKAAWLFVEAVIRMGQEVGMNIQDPINIIMCNNRMDTMKRLFSDFKDVELIWFVFSKKGDPVYMDMKRLGENEFGVMTQGTALRNAKGRETGQGPNPQVIRNLLFKVNSKLGGRNVEINNICDLRPGIFKEPVMVIGADVTHPAPGQRDVKPSIAAVLGSLDVNATLYSQVIQVQPPTTETIDNFKDIVKKLLLSFYSFNRKQKPRRIIYFRDGVSEGQFEMVMMIEMYRIQQACKELESGYEPKMTMVVVQKRHHTRFFPENPKDGTGKMKNVPPGTVVDDIITHPTEFDYYLCSHEGIQGTSKPTHYHVLYDDNNFSSDEIQKLSYFLCHTYARCTRSVSYPTPVYYAHLAAFRARSHHDSYLHQEGNQIGDADLEHAARAVSIHKNIRAGMMYYV
ncbi:unnamed protein product [Darwinula stevensoni]|uniref:Protein argonaute-2 n=1 Tax=Darwinula stevensoni TaxID=69355 RepID=A0A7R8X5X3_9CRUS|nr:unnamed protein product [Darwinula stevensoni]CAG0885094.1 unnamed protein product [Darwinula stevensoni]